MERRGEVEELGREELELVTNGRGLERVVPKVNHLVQVVNGRFYILVAKSLNDELFGFVVRDKGEEGREFRERDVGVELLKLLKELHGGHSLKGGDVGGEEGRGGEVGEDGVQGGREVERVKRFLDEFEERFHFL